MSLGLVMKKILMENPLNDVFLNAPASAVSSYKLQYGVNFVLNGHNVTILQSVLYMIIITIIFFALTLILRKK